MQLWLIWINLIDVRKKSCINYVRLNSKFSLLHWNLRFESVFNGFIPSVTKEISQSRLFFLTSFVIQAYPVLKLIRSSKKSQLFEELLHKREAIRLKLSTCTSSRKPVKKTIFQNLPHISRLLKCLQTKEMKNSLLRIGCLALLCFNHPCLN